MRDSTHFQTQPQTASEVFGPAKKRTPCIFEKSTHLVMRKPWLTEWLQDPRAYSYHQSELMFELEAIWPLWVPMGERSSFALSSNAAPLCHNTTYSLNRRMVNILLSIWGGANFYGMLQWPSRLKRSCNWQHSDSTTSVSKGIYWAMFTGRGNSHFLQSHGGQNFAVGSRGLRLFKRRCKHKPWYFKATPWVTPNRQYKARKLVQCSPYK